MRIQHNIAALNSHRNMGINNSQTSKNLEKLSSGYRINRAGDDAAGLAISEKMRGQIRGLAMAEQNTQNGVSLIQTAEGGLNETHAILQRMRELAVQSSNGTYDEDVDRSNLELEFQAIKSEIDRIAESTHYNGIKLLDGSLGKNDKIASAQGVKANGQVISMAPYAGTAYAQTATANPTGLALGVAATGAAYTVEFTYRDKDDQLQSASFEVAVASWANQQTNLQTQLDDYFKDQGITFTVGLVTAAGGTGLTFSAKGAENGETNFRLVETRITDDVGTTAAVAGGAVTTRGTDPGEDLILTDAKFLEIDGKRFQFVSDPSKLEQGATAIFVDAGMLDATGALVAGGTGLTADTLTGIVAQLKNYGFNVEVNGTTGLRFTAGSGVGLIFQIGANGGADQRVSLNVDAMDSKSIGITDSNGKLITSLASASIATRDTANNAIDIITGATNMVSAQRAGLGALQNRLEHTLNNLGVTKENLTSAESLIRDVDMASEMMEFTKNQILVQASQAMLAQANQLPQGVLSLLR